MFQQDVLVASGAVSGCWHLPQSVLSSVSLKWDITRNVFVLVVECWTEEISARPEEGAQEDHHCVCEGGCAPEEGRECLEAKPEEGEPNGGPRKCQNPGESISRSEGAAAAPGNGNLPSLLYQIVRKGNELQLESQLSPILMVIFVFILDLAFKCQSCILSREHQTTSCLSSRIAFPLLFYWNISVSVLNQRALHSYSTELGFHLLNYISALNPQQDLSSFVKSLTWSYPAPWCHLKLSLSFSPSSPPWGTRSGRRCLSGGQACNL